MILTLHEGISVLNRASSLYGFKIPSISSILVGLAKKSRTRPIKYNENEPQGSGLLLVQLD